MRPIRKLLVALGVLAVPAVAMAMTTGSRDCCSPQGPCCKESAPCCKKADAKEIVCPLTGQTIPQDECPLCKGQK